MWGCQVYRRIVTQLSEAGIELDARISFPKACPSTAPLRCEAGGRSRREYEAPYQPKPWPLGLVCSGHHFTPRPDLIGMSSAN